MTDIGAFEHAGASPGELSVRLISTPAAQPCAPGGTTTFTFQVEYDNWDPALASGCGEYMGLFKVGASTPIATIIPQLNTSGVQTMNITVDCNNCNDDQYEVRVVQTDLSRSCAENSNFANYVNKLTFALNTCFACSISGTGATTFTSPCSSGSQTFALNIQVDNWDVSDPDIMVGIRKAGPVGTDPLVFAATWDPTAATDSTTINLSVPCDNCNEEIYYAEIVRQWDLNPLFYFPEEDCGRVEFNISTCDVTPGVSIDCSGNSYCWVNDGTQGSRLYLVLNEEPLIRTGVNNIVPGPLDSNQCTQIPDKVTIPSQGYNDEIGGLYLYTFVPTPGNAAPTPAWFAGLTRGVDYEYCIKSHDVKPTASNIANTSLTINWEWEPNNIGGSDIPSHQMFDFKVQQLIAGIWTDLGTVNGVAGQGQYSYNVTGLSEGTGYEFRIVPVFNHTISTINQAFNEEQDPSSILSVITTGSFGGDGKLVIDSWSATPGTNNTTLTINFSWTGLTPGDLANAPYIDLLRDGATLSQGLASFGIIGNAGGSGTANFTVSNNCIRSSFALRLFGDIALLPDSNGVISNSFNYTPCGLCGIIFGQVEIVKPTACQGTNGSIQLNASGANNLKYSIDGGSTFNTTGFFDGLSAGTFQVVVKDDDKPGCMVSGYAVIPKSDACFQNCVVSNVAEGKSASQSSTYGNGQASRAVDGNRVGDTPWTPNSNLAHTNEEPQPWWMVDLGKNYITERVDIYQRQDCCQTRLVNFNIYISKKIIDGSRSISSLNADPDISVIQHPSIADTVLDQNDTGGAEGRYVMIKMVGTGMIHIAEVEVLACASKISGCQIGYAIVSDNECDENGTYLVTASTSYDNTGGEGTKMVWRDSNGDIVEQANIDQSIGNVQLSHRFNCGTSNSDLEETLNIE